jgi:phytoene dehydrogenase-like protein
MDQSDQLDQREYDVVVIGAGLGGLLTAAQFLRRGRRVAVVERLAHPGGRFTAKTFQGAQVSTGAVHMLPFGSNGELAGMLRRLGVPHRVHDSEVFASFHVRGRQFVCRSLFHLLGVLGPRQFAEMCRLGAEMYLSRPTSATQGLSYAEWLGRRTSRSRSPDVWAFFERICHFALSIDMDAVSYAEVVETSKNMFRYGAPGVVDGGCAAVTGQLEQRVRAEGGELRLRHDVERILVCDGAVTGVEVRDKATGALARLHAPLVISNIGPEATRRLTAPVDSAEDHATAPASHPLPGSAPRVASGLKVHLLSDFSVIPHRGIMFCLDTERIAGIVQPSNSDRRLAPPGKHLLITHQLMRSHDVNVEREAARADLRRLFGDDFGTRVRILTMSQYRGEWPVNRIAQGEDVSPVTNLAGLYLVGDAVKPSGYLMVEGVAQSVNALLDTLDGLGAPDAQPDADVAPHRPSHVPVRPGMHRALYWLIAPPRPNRGSSRAVTIPLPAHVESARSAET